MASSGPRSDPGRHGDPARIAAALERGIALALPAALPHQRWFGAKGRAIRGVRLRDCGAFGDRAWLTLVDVTFAEGPDETYALPLVLGGDGAAPSAVSMILDLDGVATRAADAFDDPGFCLDLLAAFERDVTVPTVRGGAVRFVRTEGFPPLAGAGPLAPRRLTGEQSNTCVVYDGFVVVKALRRVTTGITLDCEIGTFLTSRARFPHVPPLAGAIEYVPASGEVTTLGMLQRYVPNHGDGWSWVAGHLRQHGPACRDELSADVFRELAGLGVVTGALHAALASVAADGDFAPEPITAEDVTAWVARIVEDVHRTCAVVRARLAALPRDLEDDARALLAGAPALVARVPDLRTLADERCMKIRIHGDYHLGQTLRTDAGFVILDFEGEPARPVAERRRKQCALVDVAGMLRSLDYAVHAAPATTGSPPRAGERWVRRATAAFLEGYSREIARAPARLVPASSSGFARALSVFEIAKALYEIRYELDNRPTWLGIPLRGLSRLLARQGAAP